MKNIIKYTFTSLWILVVVVCLFVARNWNSTTALFPQSVGFPMLALLIAILVMEIKEGRRQKEQGKTADESDNFLAKNRCMIVYLGWLVGFCVLIWAIGIVYSIPIYIIAYMKLQGKYSWLKSGIYAASATAFVFILFQYAFSVSWPDGELLLMLGF